MKKDIREKSFTDSLIAFHEALLLFDWETKLPGCVFVRDYELLPTRSPYDIDVLSPKTHWKALAQIINDLASRHKLVVVSKETQNALLVAVFDTYGQEKRRFWAFFEIREKLVMRTNFAISFDQIEVEKGGPLPVPEAKWRFLLLLLQGIRRNKFNVFLGELESLFTERREEIGALCKRMVGIGLEDIESILNHPEDLSKWRSLLKIKIPGKPTEKVSAFRTRLSQFVFKYCYFVHLHNTLLYTLHGADGVGKSTVGGEISAIFAEYPLPFSSFHHITGWKKRWRKQNVKTEEGGTQGKARIDPRFDPTKSPKALGVSFVNNLWKALVRLLKIVWRVTPQCLRNVWIIQDSELLYASRLNDLMADRHFSRKIMLCDRYIYDSWTKKLLESDENGVYRLVRYLNCKAIRPPRMAIIIRDDAERIYERKKDLSKENIKRFQRLIVEICSRLNLRIKMVEVGGRCPREIASEIVGCILLDIGGQLFSLMSKEHIK